MKIVENMWKYFAVVLAAISVTAVITVGVYNNDVDKVKTEQYDAGYAEGHSVGFHQGWERGHDFGYKLGHDLGYESGFDA